MKTTISRNPTPTITISRSFFQLSLCEYYHMAFWIHRKIILHRQVYIIHAAMPSAFYMLLKYLHVSKCFVTLCIDSKSLKIHLNRL